MRRFLIVGHSLFARGMASAARLILGDLAELDELCAYLNGNEPFEPMVREKLESYSSSDEIVIFSDLFGGSANNAVLAVTSGMDNVNVIAGANLDLIMAVSLSDSEKPIDEVIGEAVSGARQRMIYCNAYAAEDEESFDEF